MRSLLIAVLLVLVSAVSLATEDQATKDEITEDELSEEEILQYAYPDFLALESFVRISVWVVGDDAEDIGLDADELTDFLRLRYKNNFAAFPYEEMFGGEITDELIERLDDKGFTSKRGEILVKVWTVGTDYPIAFHVEIRAGTIAYDELSTYKDARLGYGSKDNVPGTVKDTITEMVEALAITFFKTRGEL